MKKLIVILGVLLFTLFVSTDAKADSPAPDSDRIIYCEDGKHVFVMLAPYAYPGESNPEIAIFDDGLRAKYSQAGVYHIDNPDEPIYIVNWYSYSPVLSYDCQYAVHWGPWPLIGNYQDLALTFYDNGIPIKSYYVNDLVRWPPSLPKSVSHYSWLAESEYLAEKEELFIKTEKGVEYYFDITTGEILRDSESMSRLDRYYFVGCLAFIGSVVGFLLLTRKLDHPS
jgi:hypothetical protein